MAVAAVCLDETCKLAGRLADSPFTICLECQGSVHLSCRVFEAPGGGGYIEKHKHFYCGRCFAKYTHEGLEDVKERIAQVCIERECVSLFLSSAFMFSKRRDFALQHFMRFTVIHCVADFQEAKTLFDNRRRRASRDVPVGEQIAAGQMTKCPDCKNDCGGGHICIRCNLPVHATCGVHPTSEEGCGAPIYCKQKCWNEVNKIHQKELEKRQSKVNRECFVPCVV